MKKDNTIVAFMLSIVSLLISASSGIIAFFESPNVAHKINIITVPILAVTMYSFGKESRKKNTNTIIQKIGKSATFILIVFACFMSLSLMTIKYGYINLEYENVISLKPPFKKIVIDKPKQNQKEDSTVKYQPSIPIDSIFGIWTYDPNGPHADFVIDSTGFFYVDTDGQEKLKYQYSNQLLIIFDHDAVDTLKIIKANNDTLIFHDISMSPIICARWKN